MVWWYSDHSDILYMLSLYIFVYHVKYYYDQIKSENYRKGCFLIILSFDFQYIHTPNVPRRPVVWHQTFQGRLSEVHPRLLCALSQHGLLAEVSILQSLSRCLEEIISWESDRRIMNQNPETSRTMMINININHKESLKFDDFFAGFKWAVL